MLKIYKNSGEKLQGLSLLGLEKGAWLDLVGPTEEELEAVAAATNVPPDFLRAALDAEERSRIDIEENCLLVLTNIPVQYSRDSYDTLPLGILITPDYILTVCLSTTPVMADFGPGTPGTFHSFKRTRFLFQILYRSAALYLKYVTQINRLTDEIEKDLRRSMRNEEIFEMLQLEKSLTFFSASLKANAVVLERLLRLYASNQLPHLVKRYEEDEDLLEDVIVENRQAIEMVEMYSHILSGMMATFASIISNNINRVMKFLASATIILAVPTMVSGLLGMNVPIPLQDSGSFWQVTAIAGFLAGLVAVGLWRKGFF